MKKFNKFLLFSLIASLVLVLAACTGGDDEDTGDNGEETGEETGENTGEDTGEEAGGDSEQVLNVNIKEEPPSLNPGLASDTTSSSVLDQVFEGLTRIGPDGQPVNAMAEKIETSDDLTTYTFTIREGATWSNGDPVTAQNFEYAWKWVLNPENAETDYAYQLYSIKNAQKAKAGEVSLDEVGITAKDDKTLVVELEQPTPYFLHLTAFHTYYPVNQNVVEGNDEWFTDAGDTFVTNGPYKLESWSHKDKIVLKKNEDYWDAENVSIKTINMFMVENEDTALNMFNQGELDWVGSPFDSVPLASIPTLKEEGKLNISPLAGVYYYAFNVDEAPFNNKKIRKAFAMSINRKAIVENITQGGQLPAMALVPPTIWEENEEGYFQDNNVEEAKKLLQEGLEEEGMDELPPVTIHYNTSEAHAAIAQAIQDMWRQNLGVEVDLANEEWQVYLDTMGNGNFQVGRMGWLADFNDAINFLEIFQTIGGNNYTNWENEEYASLLEESRTITDKEERTSVLKEAEQIFMDELPISPIYYYTNVYIKKDYVKDVKPSAMGSINLKYGSIEK
ncbi:peptide ABC transporter substrate-binding protein [Filobacillus milosensis]|uniref:Peptide ABC transporter substrate-binding protein n=1 Tax=Filobacillus milosensis TaxID=94137 RepID=A0A4Y8IJ26_9BACI|nr:peptide ABC transporter substrate-binding protein [Filobacillus milosensis]TFB18890.1 peptide ABC transporter substrate-binding protein [Filobacillus milosensis]